MANCHNRFEQSIANNRDDMTLALRSQLPDGYLSGWRGRTACTGRGGGGGVGGGGVDGGGQRECACTSGEGGEEAEEEKKGEGTG